MGLIISLRVKMVNNVAKLTRSIREGFMKKEAVKHRVSPVIPAQKYEIERQLSENGHAIYTDESGNRYRIEAGPPAR